jgi:Trk K+ transport system NAD-binding subunit
MLTAERAGKVALGGRIVLMEAEVRSDFVGKSLKKLDLRRKYDVQVMLVRRKSTEGGSVKIKREIPGPDFELRRGDVMLLLGTPEGLKKIAST